MTERTLTSNELLGAIYQMGDWVRHLQECELNRWYKGNAAPKRCTCGLQDILDNVSAIVKRAQQAPTNGSTFLLARLGTIRNIAEGGLSDKSLPEIARLAKEALHDVTAHETGALLCRYCPARFMTAWEHEVHEKEHAQKASE